MSNGLHASDSPLEHEPVDEDRPADPDEADIPPLPEDERPLDPAEFASPVAPDEERRVRLDDDEDEEF